MRHRPSCISRERSARRRARAMTSAITSSATLRVLLNGALKTGTPRAAAASRSTWFVPMQKAPSVSSRRASASDPVGDPGPAPDAEDVHLADPLDERVLLERARARLDLEALLAEDLLGARVDVLQQEDPDPALREGGCGGGASRSCCGLPILSREILSARRRDLRLVRRDGAFASLARGGGLTYRLGGIRRVTMLDRRRVWGAVLAGALVSSPSAAEPARYRNFELAIYCRVDDVRRMATGDWLEKSYEALAKDLKIGKVYLETHRSRVTNDRETMLKAKRFFESRGIKTAGGITLVADEGREFKQFSYTNPEDRKHVEEVVRFTASLFDELILDDFFFTTTKTESDIKAKGTRSWSEFRLALMREAAQSLVIGPAKAVNPKIKVVIKYPNWYEHFPYAGFDLEKEPRMFDGIYTGTETRDPVLTHQHLQRYQSYSIVRYFENVAPGKNGGGWVDPYARVTLDGYAEQIALTVLAKAREITLFCFSSLLEPIRQPDGSTVAASRVAPVAGDTLDRADAILSRLGNPVGVAAYKPYQSSGEDFLHSFLGMVGIPMELDPEFREDAPVVFLNESAKFDPQIVPRIEEAAPGRPVGGDHVGAAAGAPGQGDRGRRGPRGGGAPGPHPEVLQLLGRGLGGRARHPAPPGPLRHERLVGGDHGARRGERLPPLPPRRLREGPALRADRPRQPRRPLRAAHAGPRPRPPRGDEGPCRPDRGTEPGVAPRLRQRHLRRPLLPRPHGLGRPGGGRPRRRSRRPADGRRRARAGARGRDRLPGLPAAALLPGLRTPGGRRRRRDVGGGRRQPAPRPRREHHRLRPDLAGPREGPLQGRVLREDPGGRLRLGPHQPAPVQAHGPGERPRPRSRRGSTRSTGP